MYRNDLFQPILIEECGLCEYPSLVGDWFCDDDANTPECQYDGGDCCGPNVNADLCDKCVCYQHENCEFALVGDGHCHDEFNNPGLNEKKMSFIYYYFCHSFFQMPF